MSNTPIEQGRGAGAALAHQLVKQAEASGDPAAFWTGLIGIVTGVMAGQVGMSKGVAIMCALTDTALACLERGMKPNTVIHENGVRQRLDN